MPEVSEKAYDNTTFTDTEGRQWECRFKWADLNRVRSQSGIWLPDLLNPTSPSCAKVAEDPEAVQKAVWALLEPQARKNGVSFDDFAESVDGSVEEAIHDAIMSAVVFSLPARHQDQGRKQLQMNNRAVIQMVDAAQQVASETLSQLQQDSQEPVELTTDASPSGNSENLQPEPESTDGDLPATLPGTQRPPIALDSITVE